MKKTKLPMLITACLAADAGYDAERAHACARERFAVESLIPARGGRRSDRLPTGPYRRLMALDFDIVRYGRRWLIETLVSVFKKRLGSFLRARTYWAQMREMMLRLFTLNVLLLRL